MASSSSQPDIVQDFLSAFGTPLCKCGQEVPLRTSWTENNAGRRFYGCPNYGTPRGRCKFFMWVDSDFPERAKIVINALLRKADRLEKENRVLNQNRKVMKIGKVFAWGVLVCLIGVPVINSLMMANKTQ